MVLNIIGLGLSDENDITLRGLEIVRNSEYVYLESYTAMLQVDRQTLESFLGKKILLADRKTVEQSEKEILDQAKNSNVAFLVVGDPFSATTHTDLYLRARKIGIEVNVVHNASIMSAIACCGLQLYKFGETVSIPFFDNNWKPDSIYEKIKRNRESGLHTLCLLDIKMKEQSIENMMKGREIYEPPRYMTINLAIKQLFALEEEKVQGVIGKETKAFGVARIGSKDQKIFSGVLADLQAADFGAPMHSLVICSPEIHDMEKEFFEMFRLQSYSLAVGPRS